MSSRRPIQGALIAASLLVCLSLASAAGGTRLGQIWDDQVPPTWTPLSLNGPGNGYDSANGVAIAPNGAAFVAGSQTNAAGNSDATLTKVVNGAKVWTKAYDGRAHKNDWAIQVVVAADGSVFTAGDSTNAADNTDMTVIHWSAAGKVLRTYRYDGPLHGQESVSAFGVDRFGNITVAGRSAGRYGDDWAVVSWSKSGARRWVWRYSGSGHINDQPNDLVVSPGGTVYVTGAVGLIGNTNGALTVKFDRAGKKVWSKIYAGAHGSSALAAALRPGGGVYVAGWCTGNSWDLDGLVMRYASSGGQKLFAVQDGGGDGNQQVFFDVAVASTGDVIAVGHTAPSMPDALLTTYAPDGTILWDPILATGPWDDKFTAVTTDRFGGYYLVGHISIAADKTEVYLYRGSVFTGGGFWQSVYSGGTSAWEDGVAVWNTTVYVVGSVDSGGAQGWDQLVLGYVY